MPGVALDLCSLAWGEKQGYVCLAVRDPSVVKHSKGYWKDLTFKWPEEKARVRAALKKAQHSHKDVYWAPAVFEGPTRAKEMVTKTDTLWADLDTADPRHFPNHLKPTAAWQTSPGRWQAIWQLDRDLAPDMQTKLNQRLTYALGADKGGWDLTQVLRIPNTRNHKYPDHPKVEMLWLNGHTLNPRQLNDDLPEVTTAQGNGQVVEKVPDQSFVLSRHKIPAAAKELIRAKHATVGTRSDNLWRLECLLAEAGLGADEIVGVVAPTVWNKFRGRHDELQRLSTEATKAIEHVGNVQEAITEDAFEEVEDAGPQTWTSFDRERTPLNWLVPEIWGEGEVGFISGHPKSYKSWLALDLAVSVATGGRFLGSFQASRANVLLIQEEDPKPVIQERLAMIGAAKGLIKWELKPDGTMDLTYALPDNLLIMVQQGFVINEEWLEMLEAWVLEHQIKLVILDPLMMMGDGVTDEFKAFEVMTKMLKPLKRLRARTGAAIVVVHHHTKQGGEGGAKGMYGSVALWAWEEAAMHLSVTSPLMVTADRFSKHALLLPLTINIGEIKEEWAPSIEPLHASSLYDVLETFDAGATVDELMSQTHLGRDTISRQLKTMMEQDVVEKFGERRSGKGRPSQVWRVKR